MGAAFAGDGCYGEFPELAVEEGNDVGEQLYEVSASECQAACDGNLACRSLSFCPQWGCWMKDRSFSGVEATKAHYGCQTYYKKSCVDASTPESPTETPTLRVTAMTMPTSNGSTVSILQVEGARAGATSGGVATSEKRTIYYFTPDDDAPGQATYSGSKWPVVFVPVCAAIDVAQGVRLQIAQSSDGVLLVGNRPAYQWVDDGDASMATGNSVGGVWFWFQQESQSVLGPSQEPTPAPTEGAGPQPTSQPAPQPTPEPAPAPTPAATAEQYCFGELPNLAVDEGTEVGEQVYTASATECQQACDNNPACNSFSLCPQWGCWMKDRSFSGNEATKEFYDCRTYYRTQHCDGSSGGGGVRVPTSAPSTPSTSATVSAMSYNTVFTGYPSTVSQFGAKIREVGAAVVGTQECQDKTSLANAAGYSVVPGTGFQNPILYNPSKVSYVGGTGGYMQIPNDQYAERTVTFAQFQAEGNAWWFFNTHLPHPGGAAADRNTHARIANMVLQKRRELGAGDSPTVVTGDCNPFASSGASEGSFESNLVAGGFFKAYEGTGLYGGFGGLDKIFASSAHWTSSNGADHGTGSSDHPAIAVDLTFKA